MIVEELFRHENRNLEELKAEGGLKIQHVVLMPELEKAVTELEIVMSPILGTTPSGRKVEPQQEGQGEEPQQDTGQIG